MFELRLGKLGLVLFIGGMSVLLFGLFLLGVMVGKELDTYPDQYARGIPDLLRERLFPSLTRGEKVAKAGPEEGRDPDREGEAFDLTFFDTLAGKKREAAKHEPARPATAQAAVPAAPVAAVPAPVTGVAPLPAAGETATVPAPQPPQGARVQPPAEGAGSGEAMVAPQPVGAPAPKEAPQSKGRFEVQAAAYREKGRAEQLVKKLAGLGFPAQVVMRDIPEKGRWYRVVASGFETRDNARGAAERMAGKIKGLKCVVRAAGREE